MTETAAAGKKKASGGLGSIQADSAYGFEEFQKLTGQGRTALRSFRMQGLRVIRAGNRRYILGRDWLNFLESIASKSGSDLSETSG